MGTVLRWSLGEGEESGAQGEYWVANGVLYNLELPGHTACWLLSAVETDFYTARLAPLEWTIEEKSDSLLRISVVQSAENW